MTVSIGNSTAELYFGGGVILTRMEATPLRFGGDVRRRREYAQPEARRITVEGYLISTAESAKTRRREVKLRRELLSAITSPVGRFRLRVDGRTAELCDGEVTYLREAPHSGDESEHFVLRATFADGYFRGDPVTAVTARSTVGFSLPGYSHARGTVGILGQTRSVRLRNGGDVPAGFVAEFKPTATVPGFRLENAATGEYVACSHSFGTGDSVRVSTVPGDLRFSVIRGGREINLTGFADKGSTLFCLPTGESVLTFGEGTAFDGSVTFRESFVSF